MPYCTIEEAWSTSLNPELQQSNSMGYSNDTVHNNVDFQNSRIYNSLGEEVAKKKKQPKKRQRNVNFSRTYNRLPEHSGPKTRFVKDNQNIHVRSSDGTQLDSKENHPSYMNLDLPINEYNIAMYEKLNDEYNKKQKEITKKAVLENEYDNAMYEKLNDEYNKKQKKITEKAALKNENESEDESEDESEHFSNQKMRHDSNYVHIIKTLKEENNKLRDMVNELKNTKVREKDSIADILIFIITGIVIILMMENISKLVRRF